MFAKNESDGRKVVDRFVSYATGPALAPGAPGAVIRLGRDGEVEMVNLIWGLEPREPNGRPITHLRAEGRNFESSRCLVPGSQFTVSSGHGRQRRRWRATVSGGDSHFYFAGIWRKTGHSWPACYAMLTIPANPDIAPIQDRQVAVILMEDARAWLDEDEAAGGLLAPHAKGTYCLTQINGQPAEHQPAFRW